MTTHKTLHCPQCGAALPADAPHGLCPRCLGAMNLHTDTLADGKAIAASPPLSPEELAPHFPQLEILECLGRGGMGVVYKARQKALNRFVALKLLAPERVQDVKFAERFTREAQALAALNHPHIVTVHDFGIVDAVSPPAKDAASDAPVAQARIYYLLMEFVDGVNLRQAMKAGRFTPEQALAIVPPVCEALQYAHEHGIVHRDIKPENLLLDKEGRVKIADFGIAKMLGNGSAVGLAESQPAGTPQYMAPEQQTDPQRADHRADIYSLGVVLYEMLTGELPGKRLEAPSRKVQVDVRLDEIVLRALEAKPELRYQTAAEFCSQVETITQMPSAAETRTVPAEKASTPSQGRSKWVRKTALKLAIALAIGLVVRTFFVQPFVAATDAAAPEIPRGSHVLAWKIGHEFVPNDFVVYLRDGQASLGKVMGNRADTIEVQRYGEHSAFIPRTAIVGKVVSVYWRASAPNASAKAVSDEPRPSAAVAASPGQLDSFNRVVEIPTLNAGGKEFPGSAGKLKLWVDQGWLLAKREASGGELEWQVVLARATAAEPPKVTIQPEDGGVDVRYGQFFVRENLGELRVLREEKSGNSAAWPQLDLGSGRERMGYGGRGTVLCGWKVDGWRWLTGGPDRDQHDVWIRLLPEPLINKGWGFNVQAHMAEMFAGDSTAQDDGSLLVARRLPFFAALQELAAHQIREQQKQHGPAPELDAAQWFNTEGGLSLPALRGKVVLLDFWGQWCGPCVQKLPQTEALYQRFKDRGVVVIGVHSAQQAENLETFLKSKQVTYPIAVDTGKTAERYGIQSWPAYFLVDKAGRIAWGGAGDLPKDAQIEELLKQAGGNGDSSPSVQTNPVTRTFTLRHKLASDMADDLRQILLGRPGHEAKPSAANQEITVTAPPDVMSRVQTFITVMDWPDAIQRGPDYNYSRDTVMRTARSFFYACAIEDAEEAFSKLVSLHALAQLKGDTKSENYFHYNTGGVPDPEWEKSLRTDWPGKKEAMQNFIREWNRYPLKRLTEDSGIAIGFGVKHFCSASFEGAPKDFYTIAIEPNRAKAGVSQNPFFFSSLPPWWKGNEAVNDESKTEVQDAASAPDRN